MHFAGGEEMLKLLTSKGVGIDVPSAFGTPLQYAVAFERIEVVKMLLENGADINAGLEGSLTPLMEAVCNRSTECIKLLIEAGADPNVGVNGYNISPLCWAASMDDELIINCLVEAQPEADFNFTDVFGLTALEQAIIVSNYSVARTLFPKTSDPPWDNFEDIAIYVHYVDSWVARDDRKTAVFRETKSKGEDALKIKKYDIAYNWFSLAGMVKQEDATFLSYRSLCLACMGDASSSLREAQQCVALSPEWSKAHLREGTAWRLLKNHQKATQSFNKAFKLDPNDKELREVMEAEVVDDLVIVPNPGT